MLYIGDLGQVDGARGDEGDQKARQKLDARAEPVSISVQLLLQGVKVNHRVVFLSVLSPKRVITRCFVVTPTDLFS